MDLDLVASSTRDENILMKIALRILIPVQVFHIPSYTTDTSIFRAFWLA